MSLFDRLVDEALANLADLAVLRPVVENELLHHDILREMSGAGLLAGLTFMGGTCLRACYGSPRLSEDLDFTGGSTFTRDTLADLGRILTERLQTRYGLQVSVGEPRREEGNVSTWKFSVVTRPERKDAPAQRIHLDICALPSHQAHPMMLRNVYGVDIGTSGLILQAQSREEIFADKIIALAFRENRIKNRDLWDLAWLKQQGVDLVPALIPQKLQDRQRTPAEFSARLSERLQALLAQAVLRQDFIKEMQRFLPAAVVRQTIEQPDYWNYLTRLVGEECERAMAAARK